MRNAVEINCSCVTIEKWIKTLQGILSFENLIPDLYQTISSIYFYDDLAFKLPGISSTLMNNYFNKVTDVIFNTIFQTFSSETYLPRKNYNLHRSIK